jgi:hypothetical protein
LEDDDNSDDDIGKAAGLNDDDDEDLIGVGGSTPGNELIDLGSGS